MIGIDGEVVNNSYPTRSSPSRPSGCSRPGSSWRFEPLITRWMRRPRPWAVTVLLSFRIMTIYLWHLTAMVLDHRLSWLTGGRGSG